MKAMELRNTMETVNVMPFTNARYEDCKRRELENIEREIANKVNLRRENLRKFRMAKEIVKAFVSGLSLFGIIFALYFAIIIFA
jgi:hypothetical protein